MRLFPIMIHTHYKYYDWASIVILFCLESLFPIIVVTKYNIFSFMYLDSN